MPRLRRARILSTAALIAVGLLTGCTSPAPLDASALRPPEVEPPTIAVAVLAGDDLSILDAEVTVAGAEMVETDDGGPGFVWPGRETTVEVVAAGFETGTRVIEQPPKDDQIEFRLEPIVLSGRVTTHRGVALPGVRVALGAGSDTTNDEGRFEIVRAVPGEIELRRAAWADTTVEWSGAESEIDMSMEPLTVHGVRVGGAVPGDTEHWTSLLSMADASGINAFVVDVKDEYGTVFHDTDIQAAHEAAAVTIAYDLDAIVADMDEHGIYKIARVVAFQDSPMAKHEPDQAVLEEGTADLWRTRNGDAWMDPTDPVSFEYPIALGEEACKAGFDEVQFDFASFPFGGDVSTAVFDAEYTEEVRVASIQAFLKRAYAVLERHGCGVGANVLGITLESGSDEGVGQRPSLMSRTIDVLSPMLYSTNYGSGWRGFEDPDAHAAEIVEDALVAGETRLEGFGYYRPWIQTWAIDASAVRDIQSRVDRRANGWLLWSNRASYGADLLPPR
jgi:hypothetical protein